MSMLATQFFDPKHWDPKLYYAWRDQLWEREVQSGAIHVDAPEQADTSHKN